MKRKAIVITMATLLLAVNAWCKGSSDTSSSSPAQTMTVSGYNGAREKVTLTVPADPKRIAILDFAALDIIDNLGLGSRIVGTAATSIDYLKKYADNPAIAKLGTIKEADMEAVLACRPDIIFIGGRLTSSYDTLSKIAPVFLLTKGADEDLFTSVRRNAETIASLFGMQKEISSLTDSFAARIAALKKAAEGKTAVIGLCTNGSFNVLGNNGRCSIIGNEVGFTNKGIAFAQQSERGGEKGGNKGGKGGAEAKKQEAAAPHGNETSFEFLVSADPDYIFVMDRDAAINAKGAKRAQDIMENELVKSTNVYKNGRIIYLAHPAVWYTAEGGITAFDIMLQDLESAVLK